MSVLHANCLFSAQSRKGKELCCVVRVKDPSGENPATGPRWRHSLSALDSGFFEQPEGLTGGIAGLPGDEA